MALKDVRSKIEITVMVPIIVLKKPVSYYLNNPESRQKSLVVMTQIYIYIKTRTCFNSYSISSSDDEKATFIYDRHWIAFSQDLATLQIDIFSNWIF